GGDRRQGHASQAQICTCRGDVEWVGIGGGEEVVELCLCPVDLGDLRVVLGVGVGPMVDHLLHRQPVGAVGFGGGAQFTNLWHRGAQGGAVRDGDAARQGVVLVEGLLVGGSHRGHVQQRGGQRWW